MRNGTREGTLPKLLTPSHSPLFTLAVFHSACQLNEYLEEADLLCIYYVHLADHQAVHYHFHYHGKKAPVTTSGESFIRGSTYDEIQSDSYPVKVAP